MESLELMPARVRITSILKKAIFSGEYENGQELSLTDIAEKLGVSRTPVREAFQTLATEGLIELRMNKGAIVKPINEKFLRDHYDMRILLESEAAYRAAKNGMDTSELLTRLYHMKDNMNLLERQDYINLNQQVHTSIWKAADNEKLYSFLMGLWNGPSIGQWNSASEHYEKSTQEHIQILQAMKHQDAMEAKRMMGQHISRSMDNMLENYQHGK